MAAEVESMFYVRETPWHGLGIRVKEALCSADALKAAGLDWEVLQKPIMTSEYAFIDGYKANIRATDNKVLGVVSDRYKVVQNREAFAFTDSLINAGVTYETAGSLQEGKRIWLLAKLPASYELAEEPTQSYLVFSNTHDGSGAIKAAITPVRVVCQNTLNLALNNARRIWTTIHTGNMNLKLEEARQTLLQAEEYMQELEKEAQSLNRIYLLDQNVKRFVENLIPMPGNNSRLQVKNVLRLRRDILDRYYEAPDLKLLPKTGWRFINAVSDFATHARPLRRTGNYQENLFAKTIDGHPIIDKALMLVKAVV